MNPELAVAVGRQFEAGHRDALDAGLVRPDQDGARRRSTTRSISSVSDGTIVALRLHDHRHAPHDAVALGADAEQPAPGGGAVRASGCCAAVPGKLNRNGLGSAPSGRDAGRRRLRIGLRHRRSAGRSRRAPRATAVIASASTWSLLGSARSLFAGFFVEIAEDVGRDVPATAGRARRRRRRRRWPTAPSLVSRVDQVGDARARPRPLPELAQALLVDIDDDDRPLRRRRAA